MRGLARDQSAAGARSRVGLTASILTFRVGSKSKRLRKEALRRSAACSCSPLRVNGWQGGDISHMSALNLSRASAVMPSRLICSTGVASQWGSQLSGVISPLSVLTLSRTSAVISNLQHRLYVMDSSSPLQRMGCRRKEISHMLALHLSTASAVMPSTLICSTGLALATCQRCSCHWP